MDGVNVLFVGMTVLFVVVPLLLKTIKRSRLPDWVVQLYAYGKITGSTRHTGVMSVPKRWYKHFYVAASVFAVVTALVLLDEYCGVSPWPTGTLWCRRRLWAPIRRPVSSYSAAAASVAVMMFVAQCFRRAYETHCVNVFSNAAVGLWYYVSGYAHYAGSIITIMAEAPGAAAGYRPAFVLGDCTELVRLAAGVLMFAWAYREQWYANLALAAVRKRGDRVVTHDHCMLTGGLFDLVSSPQMFTEVVMYGAWYVVLWGSFGWKYVVLFVWGNQLEIAIINHRWYQVKFKDYPQNRKAIIPYLL